MRRRGCECGAPPLPSPSQLIGNKGDLREEDRGEVAAAEARSFAESAGLAYYEVSAVRVCEGGESAGLAYYEVSSAVRAVGEVRPRDVATPPPSAAAAAAGAGGRGAGCALPAPRRPLLQVLPSRDGGGGRALGISGAAQPEPEPELEREF